MCGQVFGAQASKHQHDGCKVIPPPEIKKKEFKIVLIGGPKVGKSTLFHYQKYGVFNQKNYLSTIGAEFFQFSVVIENLQYKLNLWDCGEDRLRSLFPVFLRGADLAVLMFDLNDQQSFSDVYIWRDLMNKKIEQDKNDYIPIFLIGNKNDLEINVEKYEIQQFIESNPTNCEYEEMSLKQGINEKYLFEQMIQFIELGYIRKNGSLPLLGMVKKQKLLDILFLFK
eukprot:gene6798-10964_t